MGKLGWTASGAVRQFASDTAPTFTALTCRWRVEEPHTASTWTSDVSTRLMDHRPLCRARLDLVLSFGLIRDFVDLMDCHSDRHSQVVLCLTNP